MKTYGQYCPIARTSELLAERWTPIIIRNLLGDCRTFGDLLEGAPGISKALLAQRLEALGAHGIVRKERKTSGRGHIYQLTAKGRELKTVTDAMGAWGARWLDVRPEHSDITYVLWATCKLIDVKKVSPKTLVIRFHFDDDPKVKRWILIQPTHAEVCSSYPGRPEDLVVLTDGETLAHWHLRHLTYKEAVKLGRLRIEGPRAKVKLLLDAIRPSPFAHVDQAFA